MDASTFKGAVEEIAADEGYTARQVVEALRPIRADIPDATANNALERFRDGRLRLEQLAGFLGVDKF